MRVASKRMWVLLLGLLAACATSTPSGQEPPEVPEQEVASWEEGCEHEGTLVLLCREDECSFFQCHDVVPDEAVVASRGGMFRPPGFRRWPGRSWRWPERAEPVMTFRFNRHFDPKPPPLQLPPGRYVRHHIFSQAKDLREWFIRQGIKNIHEWTLVIPEHVHLRIHSGGPRGGMWNEAWRAFRDARPDAKPEEIYRHAGELMFRFDLTGTIVPYYRRR
jgi:uncharacterized lipoprotein (TIGR02269 family)